MSALVFVLFASARTLVLPFENLTPERGDSWKGAVFEETLSSHFAEAGYDVVPPEVRSRAVAELELPVDAPFSRASAILIGKHLGAERLVLGAFRTADGRLDVEARLIDLVAGRTVGVIEDFGTADAFVPISSQVAKNLFRLESDRLPAGFDGLASRRSGLSRTSLEQSARARTSLNPNTQRTLLERAVGHSPEYAEAHLMLGRLLFEAGESRRAIEELVAAGESVALRPGSYFVLGLSYLDVGQPDSALEVFESLAQRVDDGGASRNNAGVSLMALGRWPEAIDAFREAVDRSGTRVPFLFNLGYGLWRNGELDEALASLETALELAPYDAELHWLYWAASEARAEGESEDDRAVRSRAAALALAPELESLEADEDTDWARAVSHDFHLDAVQSASDFDLDEAEDVATMVEMFGVWELRRQGRTAEAIQLLRENLYRRPGATEVRRELVELLDESGEVEEAAREQQMILWAEPTAPAHVSLARLYLRMGNETSAREELEKALAIDPDHDEAARMRDELMSAIEPER